MALVKTTVLSASSLSRIGPRTSSGATWSRAGCRSVRSDSQRTSASLPAAIRSAIVKTSCTDPRACCRPASPSASSFSRGYAERQARAASRTRTRASASTSGTASIRPGSHSATAAASASPASPRSSAWLPSTNRFDRREARSTSRAASSSVAAWVTRAVSSWASSITTASYSGIIGTPSIASIASSEWLVTIRWLRWASSRATSTKHSCPKGHFDAPRQSRWPTLTCRHSRSVWRGRGVALTAAAGLGLLLCPRPELEDLGAERPLGDVDQRALVVGDALADPVEAGVVGPALEHGVRRVDVVGQGLDQARDVALDQLVLEREGRGGDHDPLVVEEARHEVGQRLAGARACLHQEVLAGAERLRHGLRHLHLAGPLLTPERVDRVGEQVAHGRVGLAHARTLTTATPSA